MTTVCLDNYTHYMAYNFEEKKKKKKGKEREWGQAQPEAS